MKDAIETLMLDHFRTEPFHNLRFIYGSSLGPGVQGGTCFYKTGRIVDVGQKAGFDVHWHHAFVRVQGVPWAHWVARFQIDGCLFFADMGNGWPSLKLYPADREVAYRFFGMGFRTEISNGRVTVFHEKHGKESLQLEIDVQPRPEPEVLADIERRFNMGDIYPINSLRFSLVVGSRFLFLRGDRLEIYGDGGFECVEGINGARVPEVLHEYFGYNVRPLLSYDKFGPQAGPLVETEDSKGHAAGAVCGSGDHSTTTKNRLEGAGCREQFS